MAKTPITVLADDLTGACEIAAIGLQHGLRSAVSMDLKIPDHDMDLLVFDTETRLDSPAFASAKLTSTLQILTGSKQPDRLYKKVDSVLRGPISAEMNLLAESLGYERVLLIPANPALGRTILNGYYRINGTPLHESAFSADLHHPLKSSWVVDLIGQSRHLPVHRTSVREEVPRQGLVVGDAGNEADLTYWSTQIRPGTLPAGAAAFFKSVLTHWIPEARPREIDPITPGHPLLMISGTTSPQQVDLLEAFHQQGGQTVPLTLEMLDEPVSRIHEQVADLLTRQNRALVYMRNPGEADPRNAFRVRTALARLAQHFVTAGSIRHLVVEGGATAASIANELQWPFLEAVYEWAQGVVSLRSRTGSGVTYTMKPGSYPWPDGFASLLFSRPAGAVVR